MPFAAAHLAQAPAREEIEQLSGPALLEFGASWCSHCQAAQPPLAQALQEQPQVQHIKVADGKGQPLGRSYGVKLWPTLVFLRDGQEVARLVRPASADNIAQELAKIL